VNLLTPHQLRERLVDFYMTSLARAYGHEMDRAAVERKVIAELELVDHARRSGRTYETKARRAPVAPEPLSDRQVRTDGRAATSAVRVRSTVMHGNPWEVSERWAHCVARIGRILEGVGGAATIQAATDTAEMPALAKRYMDTFGHYMTRDTPAPIRGVDHNPFRGLNDRDAARAFMRACEDIADASSVRLGPWFVPK
jgi:hypothetical protein